jgi:hypothetical protein
MAINLLSDQLREAVERSGKSRYRISAETGIPQATLSRFIRGLAGLGLENLDKLCQCIGARLVLDPKSPRPKVRKTTKKTKR